MKIKTLIEKVLEHESVWEMVDNAVVLRLQMSRDMYAEERDRIINIRNIRKLKAHEEDDLSSLVLDIAALSRVMEIYGAYLGVEKGEANE